MALQVAADQFALHRTSNKVSQSIKKGTREIYGDYNYQIGLTKLHTTPEYKTTSDKKIQPVIPSADNFNDLFDQSERNDGPPSAAQCAVHLEFLAALHELRERIVQSTDLDDVFDIKPNHKTVTRKGKAEKLKDDTLLPRRQAKWDRYVDLAVVRFVTWWNTVPKSYAQSDGEKPNCTDENLPPLDILMVWHSFLLNPRWFRQSCGDGKKLLYKLDFPWAIIHERINSNDWSFSLTNKASATFQKTTSLAPDLFECLLEWKSYNADHRKVLLKYTHYSPRSDMQKLDAIIKPTDLSLMRQIIDLFQEPTKDLKEAVLRQVSFVDKMWDRVWIRSPALEGTIRRARERYSNFLNLFKLYPTTMFVPTLDIDLVWHTHQCLPERYYKTTQEVAGKFVNHDDSIVQDKLDTGMQETQGLYRMRFGREYHTCGCWDCEALQSAIEEAVKEPDWEDIAKQVSEDVAYYRAVEVARRTQKPVPIR